MLPEVGDVLVRTESHSPLLKWNSRAAGSYEYDTVSTSMKFDKISGKRHMPGKIFRFRIRLEVIVVL